MSGIRNSILFPVLAAIGIAASGASYYVLGSAAENYLDGRYVLAMDYQRQQYESQQADYRRDLRGLEREGIRPGITDRERMRINQQIKDINREREDYKSRWK